MKRRTAPGRRALCGLLLLGVACTSSGQAVDVVLTWHLVDGRSCLDTAVSQVVVAMDGGVTPGTSVNGICHAHSVDNQMKLSGVRPGAQLHAKALSMDNAVVYRAELVVSDPVPAQLDLPLYFTGGE